MSDPSTEEKTPNFCPNCGAKIKQEGAKFCSICGSPFHKKTEPQNQTGPESSSEDPQPSSQSPVATPPPFGGAQQQQPATQYQPAAPYREQDQRSDYRSLPVGQISGVQGSFFNRKELVSIGIFIGMVYLSHLMRYFLLYNSFPSLTGLLVPVPLYILGVFFIFILQKLLMRRKGIQPQMETNRFDFSQSFVFTTFFLSFLPSRLLIDKELSNVPEKIQIPQSSQYGMTYKDVSRSEYVGTQVKPYMYLVSNFIVLVFAIILMVIYFSFANPLVTRAFQLFTAFLGSYVVVELAPVFGRHNKESSEYGRFRTLGVFLIGFIVTVTSLLGELIFNALTYL